MMSWLTQHPGRDCRHALGVWGDICHVVEDVDQHKEESDKQGHPPRHHLVGGGGGDGVGGDGDGISVKIKENLRKILRELTSGGMRKLTQDVMTKSAEGR